MRRCRRRLLRHHDDRLCRSGRGGRPRAPASARRDRPAVGHADSRAQLHGPDQPAGEDGADVVARARSRADAHRPDRPGQPERRADGFDLQSGARRGDRLQPVRFAGQSMRPGDLRLHRSPNRGSADRRDLCLCRGVRRWAALPPLGGGLPAGGQAADHGQDRTDRGRRADGAIAYGESPRGRTQRSRPRAASTASS